MQSYNPELMIINEPFPNKHISQTVPSQNIFQQIRVERKLEFFVFQLHFSQHLQHSRMSVHRNTVFSVCVSASYYQGDGGWAGIILFCTLLMYLQILPLNKTEDILSSHEKSF